MTASVPLNASALTTAIVTAMGAQLATSWPKLELLAVGESSKLAATFLTIEAMAAAKQIGPGAAVILLDIQRHAARTVLMSVEGISAIDIERAINAGLAVVAGAVNAAIGFPLI